MQELPFNSNYEPVTRDNCQPSPILLFDYLNQIQVDMLLKIFYLSQNVWNWKREGRGEGEEEGGRSGGCGGGGGGGGRSTGRGGGEREKKTLTLL